MYFHIHIGIFAKYIIEILFNIINSIQFIYSIKINT